MSDAAVQIDGLRDLVRELRRVNTAFPKEMRATHRDAAKIIVGGARQRAESMGGIWAKVAGGIQAGGDTRGGFVRLRPAKSRPMIFGAEFGAKHNIERTVRTPSGGIARRLGWNQLPEYRGNQHIAASGGRPGFMVYPTIREEGERIVGEYDRRIDDMLRRAFPD